MNYGSIKLADCANGPGLRTSLFVSGCRNHCKGCFNPETWDFEYGQPYTKETEDYIASTMTDSIAGLSILGGEPLDEHNREDVFLLAYRVHEELRKSVWIYTGYVWEGLMMVGGGSVHKGFLGMILSCIDVLVDGPFIEKEKDISLKFRGSRNQRIINVPESLKQGHVVLAEEWM